MTTVDTILADCHALAKRFHNLGLPLVAFECGKDAAMAIARAAAPGLAKTTPQGGSVSLCLDGVEVRCFRSLRPDVVVPVYRMRDGEETWGNPIYLNGPGT